MTTAPRVGRADRRGVLCVGRVYCDLVFRGVPRLPALGQEIFCDGLSLHGGGGAWITAAWITALERQATVCAVLPGVPFGDVLSREAERHGMSLAACTRGASDDPQVTVAMVADGDRAFLTNRCGAALPEDHAAAVTDAMLCHLHISELTTLLEYPQLPAMARQHGLSISLDCGWDDEALQRPDLAAVLADIDLFFPNAAEYTALTPTDRTAAPLTVIKQGARGAVALLDGIEHHVPAPPAQAIDTTGAGDAFDAGFLDAWLDGEDLPACLVRGNACGAAAVVRLGGASMLPTRAELVRSSRSG